MKLSEKDALYLKKDLDVLFVALNPPGQSNRNGHYFSGNHSTFFEQLYISGLIEKNICRDNADEIVFGGNEFNYKNCEFGVVDILPEVVETDSKKIRVQKAHVEKLFARIAKYKPKYVCIIYSKVKNAIEKHFGIKMTYGFNGKVIPNCDAMFFCNYFPNGNAITTAVKLKIYEDIKNKL